MMVEVFKTNVKEQSQANMLVDQIHKIYVDYKANFDLHDCDKILRVKNNGGSVQPSFLINLLMDFGFNAEVLPDLPLPPDRVCCSTTVSNLPNDPSIKFYTQK